MRAVVKAGRAVVVGLAVVAVLATVSGNAFAEPEGTIEGAGQPGAVPDQYIVVLKKGAPPAQAGTAGAQALASEYAGTVEHTYTAALHGFSARMTEQQARRLAADPAVAYVAQDHKVSIAGTQPSPPSWGLDRIDQHAWPSDGAYTYPNTASTVHAYVIDTGIRITHTDFGGRASYGWDFIDNDAVADDCEGHGTHVAGTIGGTNYGVAKAVQLVAVRALDCTGSGWDSQIIAAVDWVTAHAVKPAVANMSLGGPAYQPLDDAINASIAAGITYAVAAGNEGANACNDSPARVPGAITVAATDTNDAPPLWSNYGTCVDIYAPGVGITSDYNTNDTATATMDGTSMATPHVTGAAAMLLAMDPTLTPAQVAQGLNDRATTGEVGLGFSPGSPDRLLYVGTPKPVLHAVANSSPRGSTAIVNTDGSPNYFSRASDGTLNLTTYNNGSLVTAPLGTGLAGNPVAMRTANGTYYIFARNASNHLQVWYGTSLSALSTVDVGGSLAGQPVTAASTTVPSVYGRAVDGSLWQWYYWGGQWYTRSLGGTLTGDPAVVGTVDAVPMVFANTGGSMAQWYYAYNRWYTRPLGGSLAGKPVASNANLTVPSLYGRGNDGTLWQWYYWGWNWYYRSLGGTVTGDPAVAGPTDGLPMVFAGNGSGALSQWYYAYNRWYNRSLGGSLIGQPVASAANATVPSLFGLGSDGTIWQWYYQGWSWLSRSMGGSAASDPAIAGATDTVPWVFATDSGGTPHFWYYVIPTWQTGT